MKSSHLSSSLLSNLVFIHSNSYFRPFVLFELRFAESPIHPPLDALSRKPSPTHTPQFAAAIHKGEREQAQSWASTAQAAT